MANAVNQRNNFVLNTLRNAFSSVYLTLKTLSENEEIDEQEVLIEELNEIKKQENKSEINSLENMLEDTNGTKVKKTGLKNRLKTSTNTTRKQKVDKTIKKDLEKEIGD